MQEIWKDVPGFEKFYRVSNTGLVASKDRDGKDGRKRLKGRILKIYYKKQTQVQLSVDGIKTKKEVSQIVALAFLGECPKGSQACHKDSNKQNNRLSNIAYMPIKQKVNKSLNHYCDPIKIKKRGLTQELLQSYFYYRNGDLIRKKRTGFSVCVGEKAGTIRKIDNDPAGRVIRIANTTISLNRAIYLYHFGFLPDYVLCLDGNLNNTRIENLYPATASEWAVSSDRIKNLRGKHDQV